MKPPIDASLAVLCALQAQRRTPRRFTTEQIAEVCGCSDMAIRRIQKRALTKMRFRLKAILNQS